MSQRTSRPYLRLLSILVRPHPSSPHRHVVRSVRGTGGHGGVRREEEDDRSLVRSKGEEGVGYVCALESVCVWEEEGVDRNRRIVCARYVTYRSNSKARSRARVPEPKPVT